MAAAQGPRGAPVVVAQQGGAVARRMQVQMPVPSLLPPAAMERIPGCPPGLEYLVSVDQLLVHQQLQLIEIFLPYEQKNKYVVKNTMGQFIYMAVEESDLASRCCCGKSRPFEMTVLDYRNVEVIRFFRPLRCDSCCCFCCLQEMQVQAPPGTIIGSIRQRWSVLFPTFSVLDSNDREVLKVVGPFITSACCNDVVFDIFSRDGRTKLGAVSKNWTGVLREALTDIDNFTVVFPVDMDTKIKAVLLGLVFLIDFIYFETGQKGLDAPDLPGNILN
ncbi:phospholipid scramblase 2-like [Haemaphysalis longicornis]